jgi:hypothetical protein
VVAKGRWGQDIFYNRSPGLSWRSHFHATAVVSLAGAVVLVGFMDGRSSLVNRSLETTTSVAALLTFILGVLAGLGHLFTPIASAILMATFCVKDRVAAVRRRAEEIGKQGLGFARSDRIRDLSASARSLH